MDWSNEPYVRLYTRDSTTWKRLRWEARATLALLLRKVDRAGVLDIEDMEPWEAVSLHTDLPEEVTRPGVEQLLKVKTLALRGRQLLFPNHIEAQETPKSDRLRAKESRERRALGVPSNVTKRDGAVTFRDETSRPVTPSHSPSLLPRLSFPDPSQEYSYAGAREAEPLLEQTTAPEARVERDEPDLEEHADDAPPLETYERELEQGEPAPSDADSLRAHELVWRRYGARLAAAVGHSPASSPKAVAHAKVLGRWLDDATQTGPELEALLAKLLTHFFGDPWAQEQGYPLGALANNPAKYLAPSREGPRTPSAAAARGPRPVRARATTGADFEHEPDIREQMRRAGMGGL